MGFPFNRNGGMNGFGPYGGQSGFGLLGPGPFGDLGNAHNRDPFMDPYSNQNNQQQYLEALQDAYLNGVISRSQGRYIARQMAAGGGGYNGGNGGYGNYSGGGWPGNGYGSSGGCPYCQQSGYGGQRFRGLIGGTCPIHGFAI